MSVGKGHVSRARLNDTAVYRANSGEIKIPCKFRIIKSVLGF
jgi:hypothetical protein